MTPPKSKTTTQDKDDAAADLAVKPGPLKADTTGKTTQGDPDTDAQEALNAKLTADLPDLRADDPDVADDEVALQVLARVREMDQQSGAVTEPSWGEKIGRTPGTEPEGADAPETFRHTLAVRRNMPGLDAEPGPDTTVISAANNAGWRCVGEAYIEGRKPHPHDREMTELVTWAVPVVLANRLVG